MRAARTELDVSVSVSHDLRASVRAIDGFSRILASRYADGLDEAGQELLARIRRAAVRMGELIDGMLALSLASHGPLVPARIDLAAEARAIAEELRELDPARNVEIVVEDGSGASAIRNSFTPFFRTAQQRLEVHRGPRRARIELGHSDGTGAGASWCATTAPASTWPTPRSCSHHSSGCTRTRSRKRLGLAVVERIVRRHGGEVRGQGRVGHGAEFHFDFGGAGERAVDKGRNDA